MVPWWQCKAEPEVTHRSGNVRRRDGSEIDRGDRSGEAIADNVQIGAPELRGCGEV